MQLKQISWSCEAVDGDRFSNISVVWDDNPSRILEGYNTSTSSPEAAEIMSIWLVLDKAVYTLSRWIPVATKADRGVVGWCSRDDKDEAEDDKGAG